MIAAETNDGPLLAAFLIFGLGLVLVCVAAEFANRRRRKARAEQAEDEEAKLEQRMAEYRRRQWEQDRNLIMLTLRLHGPLDGLDLARALGENPADVNVVLRDLVTTGHVSDTTGMTGTHRYNLTQAGLRAAADLAEEWRPK